jgi:hypothetical protein
MINHARTLLLNVSGLSSQRQEPGEEYIPETFRPLELPSYLQTPRKVIFGSAPDRYFLNFRARELMAYLHQTELEEYVKALDPRVTYWPEPQRPFYDTEKQLRVTQTFGVDQITPFFSGDLFADNARGRSVREFSLRVESDGMTWSALLRTPDAPGKVETAEITFTNGLSQKLPLSTTGLYFQIPQPATATDWQIYTRVKPSAALTTLLPVLEFLGEPLFLELFGVNATELSYATFKNLWFDHPNPVYRISGFVLAMIYRTDELLRRGARRELVSN